MDTSANQELTDPEWWRQEELKERQTERQHKARFCKQGHDTWITGRYPNGNNCVECKRIQYGKSPKRKKETV